MAQNITLLGAQYSAVPAVTLPKTGGGTARFDDCTVVTAVAEDVAQGKIFVAFDGTITTGTGSGGGVDGDDLAYGSTGGAIVGSAIVGIAVIGGDSGAIVGSAAVGIAVAG